MHIKDKNVLDLGCVDHSLERAKEPGWIHGSIVGNARSVLGVDYLEDEVSALVAEGYNIVCADVETMDLGKSFHVIVAGELIEHLPNAGKFLERIRAHLMPEGIVLLTTPNPITILQLLKVLIWGSEGTNTEHTCWYTRPVLGQLVERYGYEIIDEAYIDDGYQYYNSYKWAPMLAVNFLLCRLRPQLSETLCVALKIKK